MSLPDIDLGYRPRSYFWAADLNVQLSSDIKGSQRKRMYEQAVQSGLPLPPALLQPKLEEGERRAWGRCHPSHMGGEYLPDREEHQVEIARITIDSTTQDVTCVYAKNTDQGIEYQVVDEYDGDTLSRHATRTSTEPLTLGELVDFFLGAWNLIDCLDSNFEYDNYPYEDIHGFVLDASSSFYPDFEAEVRRRIDDWWITLDRGEEDTDSPEAT